jgi:hypothetical protein
MPRSAYQRRLRRSSRRRGIQGGALRSRLARGGVTANIGPAGGNRPFWLSLVRRRTTRVGEAPHPRPRRRAQSRRPGRGRRARARRAPRPRPRDPARRGPGGGRDLDHRLALSARARARVAGHRDHDPRGARRHRLRAQPAGRAARQWPEPHRGRAAAQPGQLDLRRDGAGPVRHPPGRRPRAAHRLHRLLAGARGGTAARPARLVSGGGGGDRASPLAGGASPAGRHPGQRHAGDRDLGSPRARARGQRRAPAALHADRLQPRRRGPRDGRAPAARRPPPPGLRGQRRGRGLPSARARPGFRTRGAGGGRPRRCDRRAAGRRLRRRPQRGEHPAGAAQARDQRRRFCQRPPGQRRVARSHAPQARRAAPPGPARLWRLCEPGLSSVRLPRYEIGSAAARSLLAALAGGQPAASQSLAWQLVVRGSTAAAR